MIAAPEILPWLLWPAVLLVSMFIDGLFSGGETGIYVTNKVRLELDAEAGIRPASVVRRMLDRPRNLIAVLLIGTNICRYAATFSVTAMFVLAGFERRAELLTTVAGTPLLFVLSDGVPKGVYQRLGAVAVYRTAWLLRASDILFKITGLSYLVRGLSGVLMWLTRAGRRASQPLGHQGLPAIFAEGQASGVLTTFQSDMADRASGISEVPVTDVMVPMDKVVSAPVTVTRDELLRRLAEHNYSRVPLLDESGRAVGVIDIYDVLLDEDGPPPSEWMTPPLTLPADMNANEALYRLQRRNVVLAVVESAGRHVGIVTVRDLLEEIVGELEVW